MLRTLKVLVMLLSGNHAISCYIIGDMKVSLIWISSCFFFAKRGASSALFCWSFHLVLGGF